MEKCILPFTIDVEMITYQNSAYALGVLKANLPEYDVWLCNKWINCVYYGHNNTFRAFDEDMWSYKDGLTKRQLIRWKKEEFHIKHPNIISKNKEMIKAGMYITGDYDEFYIPGREAYQMFHRSHDYILFGYDDDLEVFKAAAYKNDRKYQLTDISYADYYASMAHEECEYERYISYREINKNYCPEIDIVHIRHELENYLLSKSDDMSNERNHYGIKVWDRLAEYIVQSEQERLDERFGRIYMEHKCLMGKRIRMLSDRGYISSSDLYTAYDQSVYQHSRIIHGLFIKYNLSSKREIKPRIADLIQQINKEEARILGKLMEEISCIPDSHCNR